MSALHNLPDRYRIDEMLGQRAMARTFRATDLHTGSSLALKAVRYPDWFSESERRSHSARVAEGLRCAGQAEHPACVAADHVTDVDGGMIVARPWIEGQPISTFLCTRGGIAPVDVSRIAMQCAGALDSWAGTGVRHGALTPDNVILCADGSVRVTDARFAAEVARFDLAGARCGLHEASHAGSDISALAGILLDTMGDNQQPADPVASKMIAVLRRARRNARAFANAASLADALASLSNVEIVRHVWRPATATGLMAAFGTICVLALSEERPQARHAITTRPAAITRMIRLGSHGASLSAGAVQHGPSTISPEDRGWLAVLIRRQGVAALMRPTVASLFALDTQQKKAIQYALWRQRDQLAAMLDKAAAGDNRGEQGGCGVIKTQSVRDTATETVLATLTLPQRELWRSLAGQTPAEGEPVL